MSKNSSITEIDQSVQQAHEAFRVFRRINSKQRAAFMHAVANEIEALGPELIATAQLETNLPAARLVGEKARTVFQWRSYADALDSVLDIRIDTADASRTPPKPDLRKTAVGLGVVAIFGASNFPFAFSTAGGDTASAMAAGCPVIVKTHPGHPKTSALMGGAIKVAIQRAGLHPGLFAEVHSDTFEGGQYLVSHPLIKAVGFTGSFTGGKALHDLAAKRPEPIPVFAEMGSVNPVFLLPRRLENAAVDIAKQYLASLTLGVGQFCTNPGILVAPEHAGLRQFLDTLKIGVADTEATPMLHQGIASAYGKNKAALLANTGVTVLAEAPETSPETHGNATIATVKASQFLANDQLGHEVFGPFGLVVTYENAQEAEAIAQTFKGELTATVLAEPEDIDAHQHLIELLTNKCGRILLNGFPTGVEVCYAMQHGGPYPASTDSRFTSVGPDAIKRFLRPLSYQNWPDEYLPDELKNANPLGIWRTVNGALTKEAIQ
ncbi:aldehyde dehydrogenase (NADP(+)) [Parapedobacter koreensis]|uniref:NADP-dependent aldehyde dehydrogenase n=1 Tax=Parapedobacter koreensis TaxID=332977 RepID=A0A1H7GDR5_9SPHI|nr:aldehyde dehydrogenase (NADP(+)) [Parapedobacter koreensis]SEK36393.1 NADP-dependent aldehyde dehydrogenase [Parapedobacter koreensis]